MAPLDPAIAKTIDMARHAADRRMVRVIREMCDAERQPFSWRPPKMTEHQIAKAARLQEKEPGQRFVDLDFPMEGESIGRGAGRVKGKPESKGKDGSKGKGESGGKNQGAFIAPGSEQFILASFKLTPPKGESLEAAANHLALESSTGTWTEVQTETSYTLSLAGIVYHCEPEVEGRAGHVKVAYPLALFEPGSAAQLLSCIAGNILAMRAVDRLKLMDFQFPPAYLATFPGPRFGIPGIREITRTRGHTLIGTIVKPKTGLFPNEYAEALARTLEYCCVVKDDENLTHQSFCPFHLRTALCYARIADIEDRLDERGIDERKIYLPNVTTTDAVEALRRAFYVAELGARSAMVDIVTAGFSTIQTLRNWGPPILWHGHRAMHAGFARVPDHGVDMMVIAKLCRACGIDELHIGTVVGKMEGEAHEILNYTAALTTQYYEPFDPTGGSADADKGDEAHDWYLPQDWGAMAPTMPVNSGGLDPKHLLRLKELFGTDTVTTMGGGIHGYGTSEGAWAARLAAEGAARGYSIRHIRDNYLRVVEELGFAYAKPEAEGTAILDRILAGKDWKALAFGKGH